MTREKMEEAVKAFYPYFWHKFKIPMKVQVESECEEWIKKLREAVWVHRIVSFYHWYPFLKMNLIPMVSSPETYVSNIFLMVSTTIQHTNRYESFVTSCSLVTAVAAYVYDKGYPEFLNYSPVILMVIFEKFHEKTFERFRMWDHLQEHFASRNYSQAYEIIDEKSDGNPFADVIYTTDFVREIKLKIKSDIPVSEGEAIYYQTLEVMKRFALQKSPVILPKLNVSSRTEEYKKELSAFNYKTYVSENCTGTKLKVRTSQSENLLSQTADIKNHSQEHLTSSVHSHFDSLKRVNSIKETPLVQNGTKPEYQDEAEPQIQDTIMHSVQGAIRSPTPDETKSSVPHGIRPSVHDTLKQTAKDSLRSGTQDQNSSPQDAQKSCPQIGLKDWIMPSDRDYMKPPTRDYMKPLTQDYNNHLLATPNVLEQFAQDWTKPPFSNLTEPPARNPTEPLAEDDKNSESDPIVTSDETIDSSYLLSIMKEFFENIKTLRISGSEQNISEKGTATIRSKFSQSMLKKQSPEESKKQRISGSDQNSTWVKDTESLDLTLSPQWKDSSLKYHETESTLEKVTLEVECSEQTNPAKSPINKISLDDGNFNRNLSVEDESDASLHAENKSLSQNTQRSKKNKKKMSKKRKSKANQENLKPSPSKVTKPETDFQVPSKQEALKAASFLMCRTRESLRCIYNFLEIPIND